MSLFNWMWDFGQDSKIEEQKEISDQQQLKLQELERRVDILEDWIRYITNDGRSEADN